MNYSELQSHLKENRYTWLVTGAAGFIGSNLVEALLRLNQRVYGLDNLLTGHRHNIEMAVTDAGLNPDDCDLFTFIEGDLCDIDTCHKACSNVDFILHEAALGSVPRSIDDPIATNQNNIDGFLNILVAAKDAGVKRFVYAASSSTYGDHPDLPKQEDTIGNPLSPYAVTKYVNELYAQVFARTYDFKTIGLRYFNIFGKRQDPEGAYAAAIPKWISSIVNQETVFINGDGETSRDFCYIRNVVQINLLAAMTDNPEALDQVFNVALNARTSLNQLFDMIQQRIRTRMPDLAISPPVYRDFRPGDVRHSQASIDKAKSLLDYNPAYDINAGLDEAMDWYLDNLK